MTAELRDSLAQVQELKPCPWCGEKLTGVSVSEGSTFRWRKVDGCCTDGPEVRHDTMADDQAAAEIDSTRRAIEAWNTRHGAGDVDRSAELTTAWMAGAERERDRAAEAWRPIDTLVRDGRRVLTWHDAGTVVANPQHFAYGHRGWVSTQAAVKGLLATEYCETGKVTHWRPLPAPPTEDAA